MKTKQYNIILLIAVLLMAQSLFAQSYDIVIVNNDSTREWKTVSDIDRVIFWETGTVTDVDGNVYKTVKIGDLWWMAENLKTTKYRDGSSIPNVTDGTTWAGLSTGAYCAYNNDGSSESDTYGYLYNWYAVDGDGTKELAPEGWRIPTDAEWTELTTYLGGESVAGGKLKSTGLSLWNSPNTGATDGVGFAALPGGYRDDTNGSFSSMGLHAFFWSASEGSTTYAWRRLLYYEAVAVHRHVSYKETGYSVRCVKDYTP